MKNTPSRLKIVVSTLKLLAEKDNPRADVVWGTAATSLMLCDQAGMVDPYAPKGLHKVRPKMRDAHNPPHWVFRKIRRVSSLKMTLTVLQKIVHGFWRNGQNGMMAKAMPNKPQLYGEK